MSTCFFRIERVLKKDSAKPARVSGVLSFFKNDLDEPATEFREQDVPLSGRWFTPIR